MNRKTFYTIILPCLMLALVPVSAQSTRPKPPSPPQNQRQTIVETLRTAGGFTKLLLVLDKAGLTQKLGETNESFTLFAPDDKSFRGLPNGVLEKLLADPAKSRGFILPFIVAGRLSVKDLVLVAERHGSMQSLAGTALRVSIAKSQPNVFTITFDPPAPIRSATPGPGEGNGWPCCGWIATTDHAAANGIYYEVAFAAGGGGTGRN
jgi:hypothetical protein